jgi:hypothetical protein
MENEFITSLMTLMLNALNLNENTLLMNIIAEAFLLLYRQAAQFSFLLIYSFSIRKHKQIAI